MVAVSSGAVSDFAILEDVNLNEITKTAENILQRARKIIVPIANTFRVSVNLFDFYALINFTDTWGLILYYSCLTSMKCVFL